MAFCISSMELDFLTETEELTRGLMATVAQEGKPFAGYYEHLHFHKSFGDAEFILRTLRDPVEKRLEATGMDTHVSGDCVWRVRLSGIDASRKDADALERRCVVQKPDGSGMAVVNIVLADVLPCFDEGEEIRLQMVAFPATIQYFADEEAYAAAQLALRNGRKWLLSDGSVFPSGFMQNHDANGEAPESDEDMDDLTLIRGTVKSLYHGMVKFDEQEFQTFIECVIGTEFGDLQIVHTLDEVSQEQRDNMRVGATVSGLFTLSGDAAIYEYGHGRILDEEHDLRLLKGTFMGADPQRVRQTLAENACYVSENNGEPCVGRGAIVERLTSVAERLTRPCFARMATIVSVDDGEEALPYGAGKRCVVLAYGEEGRYESVAFIDTDEEGCIAGLSVSRNSRYHFRVDEQVRPEDPWRDVELPKSVAGPMVSHARLCAG